MWRVLLCRLLGLLHRDGAAEGQSLSFGRPPAQSLQCCCCKLVCSTRSVFKHVVYLSSAACVLQDSVGEEGEAVDNLGAMGWRLGVPMCKISRDRHGPKGQWVRRRGCGKEILGEVVGERYCIVPSPASHTHTPFFLTSLRRCSCSLAPPCTRAMCLPSNGENVPRLGRCRDIPSSPPPSPCPRLPILQPHPQIPPPITTTTVATTTPTRATTEVKACHQATRELLRQTAHTAATPNNVLHT